MMWVRLDCAVPTHAKIVRAGAEAAWLWVAALCYANQHATDGVIVAHVLDAICPGTRWTRARLAKLAARLSDVGLWHPRADGGWTIHDYADYQGPAMRAEVDRKREYERARKRDQRARTSPRAREAPDASGPPTPERPHAVRSPATRPVSAGRSDDPDQPDGQETAAMAPQRTEPMCDQRPGEHGGQDGCAAVSQLRPQPPSRREGHAPESAPDTTDILARVAQRRRGTYSPR